VSGCRAPSWAGAAFGLGAVLVHTLFARWRLTRPAAGSHPAAPPVGNPVSKPSRVLRWGPPPARILIGLPGSQQPVRPSRAHAGVQPPTRSRTRRAPLRVLPDCP